MHTHLQKLQAKMPPLEKGFYKVAQIMFKDFKALNNPNLPAHILDQKLPVNPQDYEDTVHALKLAAASQSLIRVAKTVEAKALEAETEKQGYDPNFDLEAEIKNHPDSLFVKCFAIKADEPNDNGDFFSKDELKKAYQTFVGCHVFTNHQNTDVEQSRGKVVHSWWDEDRNGIMIIARVDSEAYPQLARGIKEKYIIGTSMGCQVQYSLCSICHNRAETPNQYCGHIQERKTRKISTRAECNYHEYGTEKECPICGCKKGEKKSLTVKDSAVFEYNYGIKFIENSFVVNPACHDCGVTEVIDPQIFLSKVADIDRRLRILAKEAASSPVMCTDRQCVKIAGQKELEELHGALDAMVNVSQSMLQQKDQIDLEFLADLMKIVADFQATIDELTQQGYGRLPSPGDAAPATGTAQQPPTGQSGMQPVNPTAGGGSNVMSGNAGEIGTVTTPASRRIMLEKLAYPLIPPRKKMQTPSPEAIATIRTASCAKRILKLKFRIER